MLRESSLALSPPRTLRQLLREYEVELIVEALERHGGNQMEAARLLGIPLRTLVYKLRKYDIRARMREKRGGSAPL